MSNWKYSKTQYGFLLTTTAASTLTLVAGSKQVQIFTGSTTHTMKLPDATTTSNGSGISFSVINQSTGAITIQDNGSNTIATVPANSCADFLLTSHATANGVWRISSFAASGGGGIGYAGLLPKSANYTIVSGDKGYIIDVDTSGGSYTMTLPSPVAGFLITIKDYAGNCSVNPITVVPNGAQLIDKAGTDTISENYRAVTYISDGTNWFRISCFSGSTSDVPGSYSPAPSAGRGIFGGGTGPLNSIQYVTIATAGNGLTFGNLTIARAQFAGFGSSVRGFFANGDTNGAEVYTAAIDFVTFSVLSNATTFGNLSQAKQESAGLASATRGVVGGGSAGGVSAIIDYVTMATLGNSTSFGNLTSARGNAAGVSSTTRGIFAGGDTGALSNVMDYITIASTGNATSFGTLITAKSDVYGCANATRGLIAGGFTGAATAVIEYVTTATTGNGTTFGNLTVARHSLGAVSSSLRGVFGGGSASSTTIDFVTIATTGNAVSFGTLTSRNDLAACSNSHGGL